MAINKSYAEIDKYTITLPSRRKRRSHSSHSYATTLGKNGKRLRQRLHHHRNRLIVVWKSWPNGMHNDTCLQRGYFETIQDFVKQFVYSTPRRRGRTLGDSEKEKMTKL